MKTARDGDMIYFAENPPSDLRERLDILANEAEPDWVIYVPKSKWKDVQQYLSGGKYKGRMVKCLTD